MQRQRRLNAGGHPSGTASTRPSKTCPAGCRLGDLISCSGTCQAAAVVFAWRNSVALAEISSPLAQRPVQP